MGFVVGLIVGGIAVLLAELADARIRERRRRAVTADLKLAIRAFTVDAKDDSGDDAPNGPAEAAFQRVSERLLAGPPDLPPDVAGLIAGWLDLEAERLRTLRRAAEAFFGEDFLNEREPGHG